MVSYLSFCVAPFSGCYHSSCYPSVFLLFCTNKLLLLLLLEALTALSAYTSADTSTDISSLQYFQYLHFSWHFNWHVSQIIHLKWHYSIFQDFHLNQHFQLNSSSSLRMTFQLLKAFHTIESSALFTTSTSLSDYTTANSATVSVCFPPDFQQQAHVNCLQEIQSSSLRLNLAFHSVLYYVKSNKLHLSSILPCVLLLLNRAFSLSIGHLNR